jgi:hypothetical protein
MSTLRIFVAIASFMDPQLKATLRSGIDRAAAPDRVSFGIVDQSPRDSLAALRSITPRLTYVHVNPRDSLGCCWARAVTQTLYDGEDVVLQVDSHTRFDPGWDELLVADLLRLSGPNLEAKVLLSTAVTAFTIDFDGQVAEAAHTPRRLDTDRRGVWNPLENPSPRPMDHRSSSGDAVRGIWLRGGFVAGPGRWLQALPYDPQLYFVGEELAMSMRAYTHGWDVWHPPIAPIRHLFKTGRRGEAFHHGVQPPDGRRWTYAEHQARHAKRLDDLVRCRPVGVYGLGDERTAKAFWRDTGIILSSTT